MILWCKKISEKYNLIFLVIKLAKEKLAKEKVLEKIYYDVEEGFGSVRDL